LPLLSVLALPKRTALVVAVVSTVVAWAAGDFMVVVLAAAALAGSIMASEADLAAVFTAEVFTVGMAVTNRATTATAIFRTATIATEHALTGDRERKAPPIGRGIGDWLE
jgi:hypothetical protein